jgi:hypothetical protein
MTYARLALLCAVALAAAGCADTKTDRPVTTKTSEGQSVAPPAETAARRDKALVRLVNALPSARAVSVRADTTAVFSAVPYKKVTRYREVDDKGARFALFSESQGAGAEPLADNREMLRDGQRYTVVALPEENGTGARLRVLRDELVEEQGKAHVRVIHAAPGVGEIDVLAAGGTEPMVEGLTFGNEASYKGIAPVKAGTLEVRRQDGKRRLLTLRNVSFAAGKSYTIVVTGGATRKLEVITFEDSMEIDPSDVSVTR